MRRRARIIQAIRDFFTNLDYLEVDTPVLTPAVIPEATIEIFSTVLNRPSGKSSSFHLIPSPEVWMKRLIADKSGSIFQIGKSFRNGEDSARLHNPEFTMLEWYTVEADYMDSVLTCEELFAALLKEENVQDLRPPFRRMSVDEAFRRFASLDLSRCVTEDEMKEASVSIGVETGGGDSWEAVYNRIFLSRVEPALPRDRPLVLFDYPVRIPCLAKPISGTPWCERWELYARGVEVANCYSEETDPGRVAAFIDSQSKSLAARDGRSVRYDDRFHEMFDENFPRCSGTALGVDRLIMLLTGADAIQDIMYFPTG